MTRNEVRDLTISTFLTSWGSTTPVAIDNVEFTPPGVVGEWVALSFTYVSGGQASVGDEGNRRYDRQARVSLLVNVPVNSGTSRAEELAEKFLDIFDGTRIGPATGTNGSYADIGFDGTCYRVLAEVDLLYTQIR